jgi:hypothetical protein
VKRGAHVLGAIALVLVAPLALYLAYNAWDRHRLRLFCDDIRAGLSTARIEEIASHHSIDERWIIDSDVESSGDRRIVVLASSEMGEMTCDIQLRNGVVHSAEVVGP